MHYTIYSKGAECRFCVKAKLLLESKGLNYTEILIPTDISNELFVSKLKEYTTNKIDTVPQVIEITPEGSETLIGGYDDLTAWVEKEELDFSNEEL